MFGKPVFRKTAKGVNIERKFILFLWLYLYKENYIYTNTYRNKPKIAIHICWVGLGIDTIYKYIKDNITTIDNRYCNFRAQVHSTKYSYIQNSFVLF